MYSACRDDGHAERRIELPEEIDKTHNKGKHHCIHKNRPRRNQAIHDRLRQNLEPLEELVRNPELTVMSL